MFVFIFHRTLKIKFCLVQALSISQQSRILFLLLFSFSLSVHSYLQPQKFLFFPTISDHLHPHLCLIQLPPRILTRYKNEMFIIYKYNYFITFRENLFLFRLCVFLFLFSFFLSGHALDNYRVRLHFA